MRTVGTGDERGVFDVGLLEADVALRQRRAGRVDRTGHRGHDHLGTEDAGGDGLAAGGAVEEHEHRPAGRFAGDAGGHPDAGGDLVPLVGGVEAAVEVRSCRAAHRRGDGRGARARVLHVDAEERAGGLLRRHDLLGDLGLHGPDREASPVGEHDDPVATLGAPREVVARVRHTAVVEPELALLVGVAAHVGGAPNRDPPVVGRVRVGERQRHLLLGRLDVAEHDERAAPVVADHHRKDRRTEVLGPAGAIGVGRVDVPVDRRHRGGGQDLVHAALRSTRRSSCLRSSLSAGTAAREATYAPTSCSNPPLADRVAAKLKARGDTVAVAEGSCGGLISASLLAVPGASRYFVGGSVIYTRTAKEALFPGIETAKGMRGATEEWATWLARAARDRMGTTWGIGEGGAAGPTNPYGDPAGHAWFAVAGPDDAVRTRHVLTGIEDRPTNMVEFTKAAIALLEECIDSR